MYIYMSSDAGEPLYLENCPVCGKAMILSKSQEEVVEFDTFTCPRCEIVVRLAPPSRESNNQ
jgi:predicted RNA-binding Zn-ribbon protein involved in translation (DUF1610 family)